MQRDPAKYSFGKGLASFLLCGLFGAVWGLTSVPIVVIVIGPFVMFAGASLWLVNIPIALLLARSLSFVHGIVARPPDNADETQKIHGLTDARYGSIGFGLFYLLAWLGFVLFYLNMAPL